MYVGSFIDLDFTIATTTDLADSTVVVVVKSRTKRFEKPTTISNTGEYLASLASSETTDIGNYYVQPIIRFSNGNELPCSVSSFELKERL